MTKVACPGQVVCWLLLIQALPLTGFEQHHIAVVAEHKLP